MMPSQSDASTPGPARLGVWDAVSIILGIVIGATIYETPWLVFGNVSGAWQGLAAWLLGGVLTLIGALCYAELATAYPRSGGDYVYLTRAFGSRIGFLFGWAQLAALLTGSIGMMAYIFAGYAANLVDLGERTEILLATGAVMMLALVNSRGVVVGRTTQNVLTGVKVLGLGGILVAGLLSGSAPETASTPAATTSSDFGFAMIFVLLAYGGWNDIAFVAGDIKDIRRNLPRALMIGTAAITTIYLLVNLAYLAALGLDGLRASRTPAADTLGLVFGDWGMRTMSILVMIAALGAVNGMTFVGSRVYASLGADHPVFASLGRWHPRTEAPLLAIWVQAIICVGMILVVGTQTGLDLVNGLLSILGLETVTSLGKSGFDVLLKCTAPIFWGFFLMTGLSLFVLRIRDAETPRPFPVPLYPILPTIFCAMCLYMLRSSIDYAGPLALLGIVPVLLGVPLHFVSERMRKMPRHGSGGH